MTCLIVSVPFEGHLNVLAHLTRGHPQVDFSFLIIGWKNLRLSAASRKLGQSRGVKDSDIPEIYTDYDLQETAPMKWTFPRLHALLDRCLALVQEVQPTQILYDSFAVEGFFMAVKSNTPCMCSVPSFYKKFEEKERDALLPFCKPIPDGFDMNQLEMVSDGPLIRGDLTLIWNAPSPEDPGPGGMFMGYPLYRERIPKMPRKKRRIYVSFGTVVMNHLWERNKTVPKMVMQIVGHLKRLSHHFHVYFSGQGRIRDIHGVHVQERFDQFQMLSQCDLFITHGGNNSYQEALLCGIPIYVIPFFGDQIHVAERVVRSETGATLPIETEKDPLSTEGDKFREIGYEEFKLMVEIAVHRCPFRTRPADDLTALFTKQIQMKEGDLLFGTFDDRKLYQTISDREDEIALGRFCSFSNIFSKKVRMPRILDIYHDVIRDPVKMEEDMKIKSKDAVRYKRVLTEYKEFLESKGVRYGQEEFRFPEAKIKEPPYLEMCLRGIDFFIEKGHTIHFVYTPGSSKDHYVTHKERAYIKSKYLLSGKIHFYQMIESNGEWWVLPMM